MEVDVIPNKEQRVPELPKMGPSPVSHSNTMGSLPSTIGKVALTTLQGLNKEVVEAVVESYANKLFP